VEHAPDAFCYAAQLLQLRGNWYVMATIRDQDGARISEPLPVAADSSGLHATAPACCR
jgi:hypothetical protein